jgi:hypothetical protein
MTIATALLLTVLSSSTFQAPASTPSRTTGAVQAQAAVVDSQQGGPSSMVRNGAVTNPDSSAAERTEAPARQDARGSPGTSRGR